MNVAIRSIWFDAGGVLLQGIGHRLAEFYAQKHHVPRELILESWNKTHTDPAVPLGGFWKSYFKGFGAQEDIDEATALYKTMLHPVEGMEEIVASLKGRYVLVLANNESHDTDLLRDSFLQHFRWFDYRCSSWMLRVAKPDEEFYRRILDIVKIPPEECLFIDDREVNLVPARALGIRTILFKDAQQLKSEMRKLGVDI